MITGDLMKFLTFDETRDFPYYNNNPRISKTGWFVLLLSVVIVFFAYMIISIFSEFVASIFYCFGLLIPLLYFSNWDYSLIFHRPTRNEIILGVLMFVGYMIYSLVVGDILIMTGLMSESGTFPTSFINIENTAGLVFSMMGEELMKFIPWMFLMRVLFKFTDNRNLSVGVSAAIIMILFGLIHYDFQTATVIPVLALQGFGTIFEMYGYIKTKNLWVSYISHFLTDFFVFSTVLLGILA